MTRGDAYLAAAAAAITSLAIVLVILRRARTRQEGIEGVRLLANILLLGLYWTIIAATAALGVIGYVTKDYDYWFGAMALFGIGMMLFNDISLSRSNPFAEWLSNTPLSDRVSSLHRDTRRLLDRRRARAVGMEPDAEESPFAGFHTEYSFTQGSPQDIDATAFPAASGRNPKDANVKTFTFTFRLGRKDKPTT